MTLETCPPRIPAYTQLIHRQSTTDPDYAHPMALKLRRRPKLQAPVAVLGTYSFPTRTVQVVLTGDDRIQWICDCEKFQRWTTHKEPLWCKHIAKAAARRSIERLTRRVAIPRNLEH